VNPIIPSMKCFACPLLCISYVHVYLFMSKKSCEVLQSNVLAFRCEKRSSINNLYTGKGHFDPTKNKTKEEFDANTKAAAGMKISVIYM